MRTHSITYWVGISVALGFYSSAPVRAENFERGQELYENQCGECHNKFVLPIEKQKIKTLPELREEITSWANYTGSEWGKSELDDVLYYLNRSVYHIKVKKL